MSVNFPFQLHEKLVKKKFKYLHGINRVDTVEKKIMEKRI